MQLLHFHFKNHNRPLKATGTLCKTRCLPRWQSSRLPWRSRPLCVYAMNAWFWQSVHI